MRILHPLTVRPVGLEGDEFIRGFRRRKTDGELYLWLKFSIYVCPAVESPHDRETRLFQGRLRDRERARQ